VTRTDHPASRLRRAGRLLVVVAAALALLSACTPEQQSIYDQVNAARTGAGLATLAPSPHAMDKAQAWAEHLARTGTLEHSSLSDGMPEGWRRLGENVGRGPSVAAVEQGFLDSPHHRDNVLDDAFNWVGTGSAMAADGTVYVVEVFATY
jgi:uncharacterized protein YkwD